MVDLADSPLEMITPATAPAQYLQSHLTAQAQEPSQRCLCTLGI